MRLGSASFILSLFFPPCPKMGQKFAANTSFVLSTFKMFSVVTQVADHCFVCVCVAGGVASPHLRYGANEGAVRDRDCWCISSSSLNPFLCLRIPLPGSQSQNLSQPWEGKLEWLNMTHISLHTGTRGPLLLLCGAAER